MVANTLDTVHTSSSPILLSLSRVNLYAIIQLNILILSTLLVFISKNGIFLCDMAANRQQTKPQEKPHAGRCCGASAGGGAVI